MKTYTKAGAVDFKDNTNLVGSNYAGNDPTFTRKGTYHDPVAGELFIVLDIDGNDYTFKFENETTEGFDEATLDNHILGMAELSGATEV